MPPQVPQPKRLLNNKNVLLSQKAGLPPQLQGAVQNYYQPMTFILVGKYISGGFAIESGTVDETWQAPDGTKVQGQMVKFKGVIFFKERQLEMKKEGQRRWANADLVCEPAIKLRDDDCIIYGVNNTQYRVMHVQDYSLYGIMRYFLKEDFKFSGPLVQVVDDSSPQGDAPIDTGTGNPVIM
jgi:hypothetical protein